MPTWKKVVVSGSAISQLANDANYLAAGGTFSSSVDSRLDSLEGATTTAALSASAHTQREALISSLSSSVDTHLDANISALSASVDTHLDANISALSASVDTHLDANISALSGAAHTQRVALYEINSASIAALDTDFATDAEVTALSSSAHTQREALNTAQTTANTNLSSSAASALRTEYVAGDTALSSSAHTQRDALKYTDAKVKTKLDADGVLSGSSQVSITGTTGYATFSASIDTHLDAEIAALSASAEAARSTGATSASAHAQREALIANLSASVDTHLDANISALSSSVDTHLDANISALSSSAHSDRVAKINVLSASVDTHLDANISALSGAAHTDRVAKVNVLSGSAHTQRAALVDSLSGSAHTQREAVVSSLSASAHTARANQGADLTNLIASQSEFDTAMTLSGQNVVVTGNLEVQGTTTTVDSTTIELGDNILSLNGTGAARGGIHVNDANGPLSGSFIWDGTANHWLAGGSGSEAKVFTAGGDDNLVSGSVQVTISDTTGYATYSSSVQTYTDAKIAALSASADTHLDANISSLSGAAHTQREALISSLSSSVDTHLDANISALSGAAHTARRSEISALSASAHTARATGATSASSHDQRVALIATLSASAHTDRVAKVNVLSASVDTHLDANISALSGAAHTQRDALISALSSSAATANNSSAITVRNLSNQDVDLGTGDITAVSGAFDVVTGDGSGLTNLDISQVATVASTFTNQTSVAVNHNFGTKNVIVQVYNDSDEQIIPATIVSTTSNRSTITFDTSTSGTIVVAKGGHIVSGSIAADNIDGLDAAVVDALPTGTVSGSGQVDITATDGYSTFSGSIDTHLDAVVAGLSASAHTARSTGATSASSHDQRIALVNNLSSSAATALRAEYVAGDSALSSSAATALRSEYVAADTALSASQKTYIDAKVAGIVDSAPGTLDTLNELAAALNDDPNFSASIATSIGNRLLTSTHNTYSGSAASAFRTEYTAGDTALSSSAHTQREAIKGLATSANNSLSSSIATALRSEYVAGDNALSGAAHTQREALFAINSASIAALDTNYASDAELTALSASAEVRRNQLDTALSGAAHTQREAIKTIASNANNTLSSSIATALRAEYVAGDSALSASAHTQREAVKTIASNANNTLSSSIATALRAEYVAGDNSLSSSAATALRAEYVAADNSLSSSAASALRTEYVAGDSALSASAHSDRVAKIAVLSASAHTARANQGADLTDLIASQSAFDTAMTLDGTNVTIVGNLEVSGTQTIVDSTTVEFSDNIISLNGTGAANAGIEVNDSNGPASGSLIWDGANNYWKAGGKGSETKVLVATGDDVVSGSAQVSITGTTGYATFSGSIKTYTDARDNSLSSSAASAFRTEYTAGDTALSSSAHTQREAIKGLATSANNSLSSSTAAALRTEYTAADTALSGAQNTYINAKIAAEASSRSSLSGSSAAALRTEYVAGDTALSSSAHTARNEFRTKNTAQDGRLDALETFTGSLDATYATEAELNAATASLSGAAHTQREAIKTIASNANNTLSSSIATALRAEYVAADSALSGAAHTQREAIKTIASNANNTLSSSIATALRAEYIAADTALSGAQNTYINAKIAALSASADTHLDANIAALSASAHTARGTIDSSFTIAGGAGSDTFTTGDTLTFAGTSGEIETTVTNDQIQFGIVTNPTLTGNVTITGDLTVTGDTIEQQVTNLNVEDKFILLNSGSAASDSGIVFAGQGAAFGWDESENRFALDFAGATFDQTTLTSDAFVAAVVTSDDANYQKAGNIRVDGDDIYIYS